MNRREMLRVVGASALVPFVFLEQKQRCGVDEAEGKDKTIWRLFLCKGYSTVPEMVYASDCCFEEELVIDHKCIFRNCMFEKGWTLEEGSVGTEFWGCTGERGSICDVRVIYCKKMKEGILQDFFHFSPLYKNLNGLGPRMVYFKDGPRHTK